MTSKLGKLILKFKSINQYTLAIYFMVKLQHGLWNLWQNICRLNKIFIVKKKNAQSRLIFLGPLMSWKHPYHLLHHVLLDEIITIIITLWNNLLDINILKSQIKISCKKKSCVMCVPFSMQHLCSILWEDLKCH